MNILCFNTKNVQTQLFEKMKKTLTIIALLFVGMTTYAQKTNISYESLPNDAKDFIKINFPSVTPAVVLKDTETFDVEYEVRFNDGMKIEFSEDGEWKEVKNDINCLTFGFLPENIGKYLENNHYGLCVKEIKRELKGFKVELANDVEIIFDKNGKFKRYDD